MKRQGLQSHVSLRRSIFRFGRIKIAPKGTEFRRNSYCEFGLKFNERKECGPC